MVDGFLRQMKDAILGPTDEQFDQDTDYDRQVRTASEDPYGDPADFGGAYGDVRPASEDPYGDPADDQYYSNR